ncbi:MAG TPA: pyridoxal-dependent decarboxylase, partial [Anaeromyxobacteraceae bacterium]|nr:pyridoxal-dependent decarboxylase [Anaeromyxobacteraceae bacterium]
MPLDMSATQFQELTERISRLAGDYLLRLDEGPIQPASSGERLVELLGEDAPRRGRGAGVVDRLRSVVEGARVQNGRFLGYVMGSGEPAGATA